jgi:hypothetical protein
MGDAVSEQSSLSQDSLALPCEHLGIFRGNDMPLTTNSQRVKQNTADKAGDLTLILGMSPDWVIVQS